MDDTGFISSPITSDLDQGKRKISVCHSLPTPHTADNQSNNRNWKGGADGRVVIDAAQSFVERGGQVS